MKLFTRYALFLALLIGSAVTGHSQWIYWNVGSEAADDILHNMPNNSLVNTSIGRTLASHAGTAVWKDYGFPGTNVPAQIKGTNAKGKLDLSVTINANLSYTGEIKGQAGIPIAQISGSIAGEIGGGISGTFNMFFSWETLTDMDGKIYVEYQVGVGSEVRYGHLVTPCIIEELRYSGPGQPPVISPAELAASQANGGNLIYKPGVDKFYNVIPLSVLFPPGGGIVIMYPIEYINW